MTNGVDHNGRHGRKREVADKRTSRTRLTAELKRAIVTQVRAGATLADAVFAVRAQRWRERAEWLDVSTVYRWLQRAQQGAGTVAEVEFLNAVTAAEAGRGAPVARPALTPEAPRCFCGAAMASALEDEIASLSRRVRLLESAVRELTGVDLAAEVSSVGVRGRSRR